MAPYDSHKQKKVEMPIAFNLKWIRKARYKTCRPYNTTVVFPTEGVCFPFSLCSPPTSSLGNLGHTPSYPLTFQKGASAAQITPSCNRVQLPKICPTLTVWVIKISIWISLHKSAAEKSKVHHPPEKCVERPGQQLGWGSPLHHLKEVRWCEHLTLRQVGGTSCFDTNRERRRAIKAHTIYIAGRPSYPHHRWPNSEDESLFMGMCPICGPGDRGEKRGFL